MLLAYSTHREMDNRTDRAVIREHVREAERFRERLLAPHESVVPTVVEALCPNCGRIGSEGCADRVAAQWMRHFNCGVRPCSRLAQKHAIYRHKRRFPGLTESVIALHRRSRRPSNTYKLHTSRNSRLPPQALWPKYCAIGGTRAFGTTDSIQWCRRR